MSADLSTNTAQMEEQFAFTCAYEEDRIPPRDPEADQLFQNANWRYKKNLLAEDPVVHAEVERLYRIATAWGHDKAAYHLAFMMMRGYTTHSDRIAKPVSIAERLIGRGIPGGYCLMGYLLDIGYGVEKDSNASLQYFRKAADLGDPEAQAFVGEQLHSMGIQNPAPYKAGRAMKRCAADQGHAQSAIDTAIGLKKRKQYDEALKYFQLAARAGSPKGANWLRHAFSGPAPDDRLNYMGQDRDEERAARYERLWDILSSYDFLPATVEEIDRIVPLPPAELPAWDGQIEWVKKWEQDLAPPLPAEARIRKMARAKGLDPETGLPRRRAASKPPPG
ncbi:MAG: sel1 repeat family protein [Betaproteobacteria bacterium]|nr:sel1 repeat family protein [Betaproteobacteria bacterium]